MDESIVSRSRRRGRALCVVGVFAMTATVGCFGNDDPDERPDLARINIEGTAPNALQLVVSVDFFEVYDAVNDRIEAVLNTADTIAVELPYEQSVQLTDLGSILVRLSQPEADAASVRMRVFLDGDPEYDESATMSEGGTLEYRFVFIQIGPG